MNLKIRPTCDQCLYNAHCYDHLDASVCADFKDARFFVEVPVKMGDYFRCFDDNRIYRAIGWHYDNLHQPEVIGEIVTDRDPGWRAYVPAEEVVPMHEAEALALIEQWRKNNDEL